MNRSDGTTQSQSSIGMKQLRKPAMGWVAVAAVQYFLIVFAVGAVLGTVRTLWLVPVVGETIAVGCEIPFMLLTSGIAALHVVKKYGICGWRQALPMGLLAFSLLLGAEFTLAHLALEQSFSEWAASLVHTPGWIGLLAQSLFALFPCCSGETERLIQAGVASLRRSYQFRRR